MGLFVCRVVRLWGCSFVGLFVCGVVVCGVAFEIACVKVDGIHMEFFMFFFVCTWRWMGGWVCV